MNSTIYILTIIWPTRSHVAVFTNSDMAFAAFRDARDTNTANTYVGLCKRENDDFVTSTLCEVYRNA